MATPQAVSLMQSTGGVLGKQPEAAVMCQAFRDAVDQWCDEQNNGKKHNGDFNDYFFRKLYNTPGGRSADMMAMRGMREAAFLNPSGSGAATLLNAAGGRVGKAFGSAAMSLATGASARGFRWGVISTFITKGLWGQGRPMFPDAVLRGTPVEIKGPRDLLGSKQAEKYEKIKGKGQIVVISCQSCKASCAGDNECPPPP